MPDEGLLSAGVWLRRADCALLESGQLAAWIAEGRLGGVAAFEFDRDEPAGLSPSCLRDLRPLAQAGRPAEDILERLIVTRVRAIADLLLPLYDRTSGAAGYVSFDLLPPRQSVDLLDPIRRLWNLVNRPNAMLRLPAGPDAARLVEAATGDGINLHLFAVGSLERCAELADAYVQGLETRAGQGNSIDHLASLVTIDIPRIEAAIQALLAGRVKSDPELAGRARRLSGRAGRALARLAVAQASAVRSSARFQRLAGAHPQNPLICGLEVEPAGGGPPGGHAGHGYHVALEAEALAAVGDGASLEGFPESDLSAPRAELAALEALGISWAEASQTIEEQAAQEASRRHKGRLKTAARMAARVEGELGPLLTPVRETLERYEASEVSRRIWQRDVSLWADGGAGADEAHRRLGWLTLPDDMGPGVEAVERLAAQAEADGLTGTVLLGMGGSSLAADVMSRILDGRSARPRLSVLDSTDPGAIAAVARRHPCRKTLYLVASKSGTTAEPLALLEHFWAGARQAVGERAGGHFVALTDPGTPLEGLAADRGFRGVVSTPESVGGRYSALSEFGLLPAARLGVPLKQLLHGAGRMMRACGPTVAAPENPGLFLGAVLAAAAGAGREKVTLVADPPLEAFGDWAEQLLAESSGKEGKGLVPIVGEPPGSGRVYPADRVLVYLRSRGTLDARVRSWTKAGLPVLVLETGADPATLAAEFFRWEFATAVACHSLGVNAFDQPDVQRAKSRTVDLLKAYGRSGSLPEPATVWDQPGLRLHGGPSSLTLAKAANPPELLSGILSQLRTGEVLTLLLYLPPRRELDRGVSGLRRSLRQRGITATVGYGPRYLHSTGQLHKGGPDRMVFLFVTAPPAADLPVPGSAHTFGILERAQAIGDLQALLALGRRAYALDLPGPESAPGLLRSFRSVALAGASPR